MKNIYKIIPKNFMKPIIPYTIYNKRYNTYNYKENPKCEFCNDLMFFAVGMWCGYIIDKK